MRARTDAIVAGVGETDYTRASGRPVNVLAVQAVQAACRDAGIDARDIDGIIGYPHQTTPEELMSLLGLPRLRYSPTVNMGGASAIGSLGYAKQAVRDGLANYVVIFRARNGASGGRVGVRASHLPSQQLRTQLEHPYGWNVPSQRYAMICRRYMYEHELSREQLGCVALTARAHAQLNPRALMHGRPLTMDHYLNGRSIADPYTLFDCCPETDGACAVIVTTADRQRTHTATARILAVAEGRPESPDDLTNRRDLLAIGLDSAAPDAWEAAGLGPGDMDAAMIYDCFTFELIHQLESAGFVPHGEAGRFIAKGGIGLGGALPVNTHGGLLSEGHMVGLNHVVEAVRQLRWECGDRQVTGARLIAVTGWGDLGDGALAVLDRRTGTG